MHLVLHEKVDHGEECHPKSGKRQISKVTINCGEGEGRAIAYSEAILILIRQQHMNLTRLAQQ